MAKYQRYFLVVLVATIGLVSCSDVFSASSGSDSDDEVSVDLPLPKNIYGGLEKGSDSFKIDSELLWQAVSEGIGNGFSTAKAVQMIDGGEVVGQFQKVVTLSQDGLADALKSGLLEVESSVSQSQCDGSTTIESDEMAVQNRLWAELGFKAPAIGGTVGASVKTSYSNRQIDHVSEVNINTKCLVSLFSVNLTPKGELLRGILDSSLVRMWNALPTTPSSSTRKAYFDFFNRYGTHVVRAASFGGLASLTATVETSLLKKVDNAQLRMGVSLWLSGVSLGGGGSVSAERTIKSHRSQVKFRLKVAGGNSGLLRVDPYLTEPIAFENLNKWKMSLQEGVARVSTEIGTLAEFMDVALGETKTSDDLKRIRLFEHYLVNDFEKLVTIVEKNKLVSARLLDTLDDYSKTMFEVKKIQSSRGFLSGGSGRTMYSLSRTFDGLGSLVCHNIPFVCDQRCLAQENIEYVQRSFFDVHTVGAPTVSCRSLCIHKYSNGCENFSIQREEFIQPDLNLPPEKKNIRMKGWVWKRNKRKFLKRGKWLKRYLILSENSLYYKKKEDSGSIAIVRLNQIGGIIKGLPLDLADGFGFRLVSYDRMWIFKCSSEEERDEWVAALMSHSDQFSPRSSRKPFVFDLKDVMSIPEATALPLDKFRTPDDLIRELDGLGGVYSKGTDAGYDSDTESTSDEISSDDDLPYDPEDDDFNRDVEDGKDFRRGDDLDDIKRTKLETFLRKAARQPSSSDSEASDPSDPTSILSPASEHTEDLSDPTNALSPASVGSEELYTPMGSDDTW